MFRSANTIGPTSPRGFRPLAITAQIECCNFLDGTSWDGSILFNYRPNQYYEVSARYELTRLDMPGGDVDIHVGTINSVVTFTPTMQLDLQTQYDNISQDFGFLARYRWEFTPGDELFVAFGQAATIPSAGFRTQRSQLSVRVGRTFRF